MSGDKKYRFTTNHIGSVLYTSNFHNNISLFGNLSSDCSILVSSLMNNVREEIKWILLRTFLLLLFYVFVDFAIVTEMTGT